MGRPCCHVRSLTAVSSLTYVLELDGMEQSCVDLSDPTRLHFDYVRRIADVIDRHPAERLPQGRLAVLHVGGAAMTLARYVHARRPRSPQVVLEPSAEVVEQVRTAAPLPARSGIKVRVVDGSTGIAAVRDASQDVVVLDAFDGAQVPHDLTTGTFIDEVARVLAPGGVLLANLRDRAPFPLTRDVIAAARRVGEVAVGVEPATVKAKREGNLVVAAGALPVAPFGAPAPSAYRTYTGAAVSDTFGGGRVRE